MKRYLRERLRSLRSGDSGFTLVELLVVVGIIVALAAVIIPNVASFANKGEEGAKAAERDNIQASIDAYMADNNFATLPAGKELDLAVDTSERFFGTGATLDLMDPGPSGGAFMRAATTSYAYCWNPTGLVLSQDDDPTLDCTD